MVDVITTCRWCGAFCGLSYEHDRFDATVNRELNAAAEALRYLEKLRLPMRPSPSSDHRHAGLGRHLWQQVGDDPRRRAGVQLGISILSATRDLAVALVDVTQHVAG